ncbi:hypothetical protein BCON_0240g00080 [Botryotinia convoluta]|uniref:Uncharacterized protein n=1 Tax=Botryotinia convoluta TaxID=54673 RepID=A0A4Z1HHG1_9HELO|nr:hypothetical protein BCON_0240g00080 [Botryotinia convoluta]
MFCSGVSSAIRDLASNTILELWESHLKVIKNTQISTGSWTFDLNLIITMNPYHVQVYSHRPGPSPRDHLTPTNIRDYYAFPQNRLPPLRIVYGNNQSNEAVRRHLMNAGRAMEPNARINGPYACPYVRYATYRRMGWGPQW